MNTRKLYFLMLLSLIAVAISAQHPVKLDNADERTFLVKETAHTSGMTAEAPEKTAEAPEPMQQPVKIVDSTGADVPLSTTTEAQHDSPLGTITNTKGLLDFGRASTPIPSAVSADDDGVVGWYTRNGAKATFQTAHSAGGVDTCFLSSAATTNATNCKAGAGTLYDFSAINTTAVIYYLRFYNLASAPTCSSATGFVESVPIPANASLGAGVSRAFSVGRNYSTGIGFCLTLNGANNDNNAAVTGIYISIGYK